MDPGGLQPIGSTKRSDMTGQLNNKKSEQYNKGKKVCE